MLRNMQLNYSGSPVQFTLDNTSGKNILLNMRIPGNVSRALTSNADLKMHILEDGRYQIALARDGSSLGRLRSKALESFKEAIAGPVDSDSLSQKLIEIVKEDPRVENAWLLSGEDSTHEEANDKGSSQSTIKLGSPSQTYIEIKGKDTLDEDDRLFFNSLMLQVDLAKQCVGRLLGEQTITFRALSDCRSEKEHALCSR